MLVTYRISKSLVLLVDGLAGLEQDLVKLWFDCDMEDSPRSIKVIPGGSKALIQFPDRNGTLPQF